MTVIPLEETAGYGLPRSYRFSESGTGSELYRPATQASRGVAKALPVVTAGMILLLGAEGTSIRGMDSFPLYFASDWTDRGELAQVTFSPPASAGADRSIPTPVVVPLGRGVGATRSDKDEVLWAKEHSGLTWDQLGKIFGVSRRAVHMWATGGRLNQANAQHVRSFAAVIREVESSLIGPTPGDVRARLLQVGSDGLSVVDRLRQERASGYSWASPFGPDRLIDAVRGPLRHPVGEAE